MTKSNRLRLYSTGPDGRLVEGPESGFLADVHLVPALRTNAIIVTAPTKTMRLIEKLIESSTRSRPRRPTSRSSRSRTADANLTANLLRQLFLGQAAGGGGTGRRRRAAAGSAAAQANALQTRPLLTLDGDVSAGCQRSSACRSRWTTGRTRFIVAGVRATWTRSGR